MQGRENINVPLYDTIWEDAYASGRINQRQESMTFI